MVTSNANYIPYLFRILSDEAITDVPTGLPDHVSEENALNFIEKKDLGDCFEDFVDGILEGDGA